MIDGNIIFGSVIAGFTATFTAIYKLYYRLGMLEQSIKDIKDYLLNDGRRGKEEK